MNCINEKYHPRFLSSKQLGSVYCSAVYYYSTVLHNIMHSFFDTAQPNSIME